MCRSPAPGLHLRALRQLVSQGAYTVEISAEIGRRFDMAGDIHRLTAARRRIFPQSIESGESEADRIHPFVASAAGCVVQSRLGLLAHSGAVAAQRVLRRLGTWRGIGNVVAHHHHPNELSAKNRRAVLSVRELREQQGTGHHADPLLRIHVSLAPVIRAAALARHAVELLQDAVHVSARGRHELGQSAFHRQRLVDIASHALFQSALHVCRVPLGAEALHPHPLQEEIAEHRMRARILQHPLGLSDSIVGVSQVAIAGGIEQRLVRQPVPVQQRHPLRQLRAGQRGGAGGRRCRLRLEDVQELRHLQDHLDADGDAFSV